MKKIRVMLVDDHVLVREGVRTLLEAQSDVEVVAEAANGAEALEKARTSQPDVVLMDIGMPGMSGLEATRLIRQSVPGARILVVTIHSSDDYFFRILDAGASGYILKEAAFSDLISAVRAVYHGGVFLYPSVAGKLVEDYLRRVSTGEERASYDDLTPREKEVLRLIGEGCTNQEIGEALHLSVNTVQTHRAHIMEKLNLHSRADLVKYAMRMGLLSANT